MLIRESFKINSNSIVDIDGKPFRSSDSHGVNVKFDPKNVPDRVLVKVPGTHGGFINHNGFFYKPDGMGLGYLSWTNPYHKPVLVNHDESMSPIGRVIDASFVTDDPSVYQSLYGRSDNVPQSHINLSLSITDKEAIQKILNGQYLTVSQSGICYDIRCSVCDSDVRSSERCDHQRNSNVDGKRVYWKFGALSYKEISFVNVPSDEFAKVEEVDVADKLEGVLKDSHIDAEEEKAVERCMITVLDRLDYPQEERMPENKDGKPSETQDEQQMYKDLDEQLALVMDTLADMLPKEIADATLSAGKGDKLPDSAFCGPNRSFPVPDCIHATAAKHVIEAYDGPGDKSKIVAAVNAKISSFDCAANGADHKHTLEDFVKNLGDYLVLKTAHESKIQELQDQITALTTERDNAKNETASKEQEHRDHLAHTIVDLRLALGKIDKEKSDSALAELSKRSADSLNDTINDLRDEIEAPKLKPVADPAGVSIKDGIPGNKAKVLKPESRKEAVHTLFTLDVNNEEEKS